MKRKGFVWMIVCLWLMTSMVLPAYAAGKVADVNIQANPAKLQYTEGEHFDPTGMVIVITYEDGTTAPAGSSEYQYSPTGPLSAVHRAIVIDCAGKRLTLPITVVGTSGTTAGSGQQVPLPQPGETPPQVSPESPEEHPQGSESNTPHADRQGQNWNFFHWTGTILLIVIVAGALVIYDYRYFGRRH